MKKFILIILCALCCIMTACNPLQQSRTNTLRSDLTSGTMPSSNTELLRADPGYIQWLTQQSFLHTAKELIGIVSGSSLAWHHDGTTVNHWPLLQKASIWLELSPKQMMHTPDFSSACNLLAQPSMVASLQQKDLALYLSDILDTNSVWALNTTKRLDGSPNDSVDNSVKNFPVSYEIASQVGTEQELMTLSDMLRQQSGSTGYSLRSQLLGTDIIPASTSLGPDFFLAARGHKDYIGAYAMIEIPQQEWGLLPNIEEDWQCQALSHSQRDALAQKGLTPTKLYSDNSELKLNIPHSWAVTGSIRGVDGNLRRWVYAYTDSPMHPILHWNDPSKLAQRIFSASIIKNTGMLGIPLVGLSLQDFCGFEVQTSKASITDDRQYMREVEPMLTAATTLAHEIRSYGGWSWLRQALPTTLLASFMASPHHDSTGPDFFTSRVGEVLEQALHEGQAYPLHDYFDEILEQNIDCTRLAHILPSMGQDTQNLLLATTFLATQAGLVFLPAQNILPLANQLTNGQSTLLQQKTMSPQNIQKSILCLPDWNTWREEYHLSTAKLMARLPSSDASLILLSALTNDNNNTKTMHLVTITNTTNKSVHEKISLYDYFPQKISTLQEIHIHNSPTSTPDTVNIQGYKHNINLEIPAKTCRAFLVTSL